MSLLNQVSDPGELLMKADKTVERVQAHAGLESDFATNLPTVSEASWPRGAVTEDLKVALTDLIDALAQANRQLNHHQSGVLEVPRKLAYAVSEIMRMLRESGQSAATEPASEWLDLALWRVESAWLAILAGDIEDLEEFLRDEEAARFE